jgi:hypothetical protein
MGISNKTAQHRIQLALQQVFCQISTRTGLFAEMHPITGLPDLVISHCASFWYCGSLSDFKTDNLSGEPLETLCVRAVVDHSFGISKFRFMGILRTVIDCTFLNSSSKT